MSFRGLAIVSLGLASLYLSFSISVSGNQLAWKRLFEVVPHTVS